MRKTTCSIIISVTDFTLCDLQAYHAASINMPLFCLWLNDIPVFICIPQFVYSFIH